MRIDRPAARTIAPTLMDCSGADGLAGEAEAHPQSAFRTVFERDLAAMALGDRLDESKPKPAAPGLGAARGFEAHKRLKDPRPIRVGNPGTLILHDDVIAIRRGAQAHVGAT